MDSTVPLGIQATANLAVVGSTELRTSSFYGYTPIGRHSLIWLEYSGVTGVTTFYGDLNVPTIFQAGIVGSLMG